MTRRLLATLDPHPFARGGSVAICAVSVMHLIQAGLLLWSPAAGNATGMRALLTVLDAAGGGSAEGAAPAMVIAALLAAAGALLRLGWVRLLIFVPQHLVLGVMALGGLYAASRGAYLDGTVIGWEHILADQLPLAALFVVHSSAILRRAWDPNG
jgi:hypothetical protein